MAQILENVEVAEVALAWYRPIVRETSATRVCTSTDYGKVILCSYEGAVAITLPANGAPPGAQIHFINIGSNNCAPTVSAATAETLITVNNQGADSVTYGTGHRIGSHLMCISTGTYWVAVNLGSTTLTVTD